MKTNILLLIGFLALTISACEQKDPVQAKKEKLKEYKTDLQKIKTSITKLETELSEMDPEFAKKNRKATLITTTPVEMKTFEHFVEVSGAVQSRKNVLISAENFGSINHILVKEGDEAKKCQLIMSMDTELYQKNLDQLKTEYALANTMFEKQSNLWKQNIGTEVQFLQAKNRKESLENQISNIKIQISKSQLKAPFDGTIEEVLVREGEMAQMGSPLIRIVNHRDMYIKADMSESYIGQFKKGDKITIYFPSLDKTVDSIVSSVGQVIDANNRTFPIEALLPTLDFSLKPNLMAVVKVKDFEKANAVVIPTKLIQRDNKGEFVYVTALANDETIAKKIQIDRGITYQNSTMVKSGLKGNEILVDEGFRNVADGGKIKEVETVL